jgi:OFA family oxalate/formate antiporter-like MFS transporter
VASGQDSASGPPLARIWVKGGTMPSCGCAILAQRAGFALASSLFALSCSERRYRMSTSESKLFNRWWVVFAAVLIQLCLGAIYAWSVFTPYLKKAPFSFSNTQTQVVFSVGLATFAVVMVLAGRWQAKSGPRIVALTGGLVLGAGYLLAGLLGNGLFGYFVNQVIFIGLVGGAGIGLAYVCPIAVGMKWFPDKKGLITGLAVSGFGFGATIWVKMAGDWGHLLDSLGVLGVFIAYGIVFAIAVVIGSIWMVNPPAGWSPPGWKAPVATKTSKPAGTVDLEPSEMLRRGQFYAIWVMFTFSAMAGLMTIGNIALFGIEALKKSGLDAAQAAAVSGTAMGVFYALANGLGRIVWGIISDKIGRKLALVLMCTLQGVIMILFFWMGSVPGLLYLGATIIGFNFGGNFSLFPTMTADLFGTKNVGRNYGWVFTAYGLGGIIGPIMAATFRDVLQNWAAAFIVSGIACFIAAVIGYLVKPPKSH